MQCDRSNKFVIVHCHRACLYEYEYEHEKNTSPTRLRVNKLGKFQQLFIQSFFQIRKLDQLIVLKVSSKYPVFNDEVF